MYENGQRKKIDTIKHQRIWPQPTQFQNLGEIFKIEFPGNWTKTFI